MHLCIQRKLESAFQNGVKPRNLDNANKLLEFFIAGLESVNTGSDAVEDIDMLTMMAEDMGKYCPTADDAVKALGQRMAETVRLNLVPFDEWKARHRRLRETADEVTAYRNEQARRLCEESGLDGNLLGIHPHNAAISRDAGQPWPGIDYAKVDECMALMRSEFAAYDMVAAWDKRLRCY
jgi:hypothetical protein